MILISGGLGYIGSHTALMLLEQGKEIVIVDNLYNSTRDTLVKLESVAKKQIHFYELDCCDQNALENVFVKHHIEYCIHFAGYKITGESTTIPLEYYYNNISSALILLKLMKKNAVKSFIFSSSAAVYGNPEKYPITEDFPLSVTNPYGRTKLMIEDILRDLAKAEPDWSIGILRYFNPIGAHKSGLIGDNPDGIPTNIMPYIAKVAAGKIDILPVFGNDYETKDGTGVRDYIHVMDLAKGHAAMLNYITEKKGLFTYNLGSGKGHSVFDIIAAFEAETGKKIPYEIKERRQGDIVISYASVDKALNDLNWACEHSLEEMIEDAWRFEQNLKHN